MIASMAWSVLFDFSTACRREARKQHDRCRLEARRRVREEVRGRRRGVEMARDGSAVDARHWRREAVHREDSEQQFKAPHLISSVCSSVACAGRTAARLARVQCRVFVGIV